MARVVRGTTKEGIEYVRKKIGIVDKQGLPEFAVPTVL
jgi:hypothetical protein